MVRARVRPPIPPPFQWGFPPPRLVTHIGLRHRPALLTDPKLFGWTTTSSLKFLADTQRSVDCETLVMVTPFADVGMANHVGPILREVPGGSSQAHMGRVRSRGFPCFQSSHRWAHCPRHESVVRIRPVLTGFGLEYTGTNLLRPRASWEWLCGHISSDACGIIARAIDRSMVVGAGENRKSLISLTLPKDSSCSEWALASVVLRK